MRLIDTGPSPRGIHGVDKFWRCPRLYALARLLKNQGEEEDVTDAMQGGTLLHAACAHHYARMGAATPQGVLVDGVEYTDPDAFYEPHDALDLVAATMGNLGAKLAPKMHDAFRAYTLKYDREPGLRVLAVETVFWYRFAPPPEEDCVGGVPEIGQWIPPGNGLPGRYPRYDLSCRADLVIEDRGRKVWIVDHKGCSSPSRDLADSYARSGQFQMLRWVGSTLGARFGGPLLNLIQREPPHRMDRPPLIPTPHRTRWFPQDVTWALDQLWALDRSGRPAAEWPARPSALVCRHRWDVCEVAEHCDWGRR